MLTKRKLPENRQREFYKGSPAPLPFHCPSPAITPEAENSQPAPRQPSAQPRTRPWLGIRLSQKLPIHPRSLAARPRKETPQEKSASLRGPGKSTQGKAVIPTHGLLPKRFELPRVKPWTPLYPGPAAFGCCSSRSAELRGCLRPPLSDSPLKHQ